jgi:hypothetical protein
VAALVAVIINMFGFDVPGPINCQVSPTSASFHIPGLTSYDPKAVATSDLVSTSDALCQESLLITLVRPLAALLVPPLRC